MNNWKKYMTLSITFLLFINICLIFPTGGNNFYFSNIIIVPDDYQTIQEAIDSSKKGDIIYVKNGIYYENLIIDKPIKLIGEDKNTTIIDGFQNKSVIKILSDNVFVNDFTIQNSSTSSFEYAGIESYSSNNYFVRNIIKNNKYGINSFDGNNNTIMYNFLNNNQNDSLLINSPYNVIYRNYIEDNAGGIFLKINATNNDIKQNNFINNTIYNANFYKE